MCGGGVGKVVSSESMFKSISQRVQKYGLETSHTTVPTRHSHSTHATRIHNHTQIHARAHTYACDAFVCTTYEFCISVCLPSRSNFSTGLVSTLSPLFALNLGYLRSAISSKQPACTASRSRKVARDHRRNGQQYKRGQFHAWVPLLSSVMQLTRKATTS